MVLLAMLSNRKFRTFVQLRIAQTLGLERTTPAITGFITGLYVVFTPLIASIFLKEKLTKAMWGYVFLAVIGLGVLSLQGWSIGVGELFV
ncbi:MAG UNVERIFIED_CONTAM: EamA family transporter [Rickettsiaceae bacterium]